MAGDKTRTMSLRERKHAQTKLALLRALLEKLKTRTLDEIPVEELCEEAQVSKVTFYNYFPKKTDLLVYYLRLSDLRLSWEVEKMKELPAKEVLCEAFRITDEESRKTPQIVPELMMHFIKSQGRLSKKDMAASEKKVAYPGLQGIERIHAHILPEIVKEQIKKAKKTGELPGDTDVEVAFTAVLSIKHAVCMSAHRGKKCDYKKHLDIIWRGLEGK